MKPCISTGNLPGSIQVTLALGTGATLIVGEVPGGTVMEFGRDFPDATVTSFSVAGVDADGAWYELTVEQITDLYEAGVSHVRLVLGEETLAAGAVVWRSAWAGACGTTQRVEWVAGPRGKPGPGVAEGGDTGQVLVKASGDDFDTEWVDQTGGGGTDLTSYVDQVETLPDYPAAFPPASHTHAMGQVDGLADALDGKQPTGDYLTPEDLPAPPDLSPYATKTALAGVESTIPTAPADIGAQPAGDYVTDDDPRLTDARTPLAHTHPASDVTGLAPVATSGAYGDLTGTPSIPTVPQDIGAQPEGDYASGAQGAKADTAVQPGDLATVATTGAYSDLTGLPLLVIDEGDPIPPGTPTGTLVFERTTP